MDARYLTTSSLAAAQHGSVSLDQLEHAGVDRHRRKSWVDAGLILRAGPRSYVLTGSASSWLRDVWCGMHDLGGDGFVAGRTGAHLLGLDGFRGEGVELIVPRSARGRRSPAVVRSTSRPLGSSDLVTIDGLRVLAPQRLILEAPLFGFSRGEMERAIDSAVRKRLVSEQRLRTAAIAAHRSGVNGSRQLLDVLIDAGGESNLERRFLRIVREGGLSRPELQRVFRSATRIVARVDAFFPGNLVVELDGHGSHATRQERQRDAQRRTELLLKGCRVLTFTYDDVRYRPDWVLAQLTATLRLVA